MKYPAIYKSVEGGEYLYQNKDSYYCYERQIWDSSEPHHDCHHSDTNITTEYLANTYGEVKSKEHAEFIVKLAETAKCAGLEVAKHKISSTESFRGICFNFYTDNETLWFAFHHESQAKNRGEKQITIPLQPESKDNDSLKNNGDNLIFGDADKCKEWPCVGDEVGTRFGNGVIKLLPDLKDCYVIDIDGLYYQLKRYELEKPKTPEDELRELLSLLWKENNNDFDMFLDVVTCHVTKKPQ